MKLSLPKVVHALDRLGYLTQFVVYVNHSTQTTHIALDFSDELILHREGFLNLRKGKSIFEASRDPLAEMQGRLKAMLRPGQKAFGYITFDLCHFYFPFESKLESPLVHFVAPAIEILVKETGFEIVGASPDRVAELTRVVNESQKDEEPDYDSPGLELSAASADEYLHNVTESVQEIRTGAFDKVIISRRADCSQNVDLVGSFIQGYRKNPSVRSFVFRIGNVAGTGFSPEILLTGSTDGLVTTNPLAGTRRRGRDAADEAKMMIELKRDPKEVKEHALSVLLAQEELNGVCDPESVNVTEFMNIKKYRTVQHLSSRVHGHLSPERNFWDAMRAVFPGVTISGIAKKEAVQWIGKTELASRGIYSGCIGYADAVSTCDFGLAIRSLFQYAGKTSLHAGAGIVAESDPRLELMESRNKMRTMADLIVTKK